MNKQFTHSPHLHTLSWDGSHSPQAQVVVRIGPPAHVVERVPPPPHEHSNWAWHEGYHRWDGNRCACLGPRILRRATPHAHAVWVRGANLWVHERGGYVWHEGRWR